MSALKYFVHESAYIDHPSSIGEGTKIWHFSHVMRDAVIGKECNLGQNVQIAVGVQIGNNVKIQNNVAVYTGTVIEDDVFLGPSCVLTNVTNPRSQIVRHSLYEKTLIRRGATVGANATIVCGFTLGKYCFIAAGAVVTADVLDYALMAGVPAKQKGWMSRHGHRLANPDTNGIMICPESGYRYRFNENRESGTGGSLEDSLTSNSEPHRSTPKTPSTVCLRCLDIDEETPLPDSVHEGTKTYREFRE
ncbi:MAG: acyltransferase [Verrucomicrobia bacterium]|nr:acyltransferase [Verrucomicrobiota bacterium]